MGILKSKPKNTDKKSVEDYDPLGLVNRDFHDDDGTTPAMISINNQLIRVILNNSSDIFLLNCPKNSYLHVHATKILNERYGKYIFLFLNLVQSLQVAVEISQLCYGI